MTSMTRIIDEGRLKTAIMAAFDQFVGRGIDLNEGDNLGISLTYAALLYLANGAESVEATDEEIVEVGESIRDMLRRESDIFQPSGLN